MNTYEALGTALVIYLAVSSIAGHIWIVWYGKTALKKRLHLGSMQESEAIKRHMEYMFPER